MTGRLATLEEIVDWQPYDRVAWRRTVPGLGPFALAADLEPTDAGTRLTVRWAFLGAPSASRDDIERLRVDQEAAFGRLAAIVTDMPGVGDAFTSESLQGLLPA